MDEVTSARSIERELETLRRFWGARRDRVFLAAAQAALDKRAGARPFVLGAHQHLLFGDEIYQADLDQIEDQIDRVIESWKHCSELVFRTTQKFIDWWTPGVYIIALTPETIPVQVKVGRTISLPTWIIPPYRRICPTLQVLQHLPATQFGGTLLATEGDLIRMGKHKQRLTHIGGEVFHARDLADAVAFGDEARRHIRP